jgi:cyclophilin family peptidyl-prolyl cis-trans isomerase
MERFASAKGFHSRAWNARGRNDFIYKSEEYPLYQKSLRLQNRGIHYNRGPYISSLLSLMNTIDQTAPIIRLETSLGIIDLELSPLTPLATENFVKLAESGYYDGVIFHRVIEGFMIQGGDPTGTGMGGKSIWKSSFADEFHPSLSHVRGVISMANAGRNTNGSQFFIVTAPETKYLDGKHSVFGKVISGMEVVEAIEQVATDRNDRPKEDVIILSAKRISE